MTEIVERASGELLAAFRRSGVSTGPGASTGNYLVRFSADGEALEGGGQNLSSLLAGESSGPLFVGDSDVSFGRKSRLPFTTTVRAIGDEFEVDTSFGLDGGAPVYPGRFSTGPPAAMTLDSAGRPVVAAPVGSDGLSIIRLEVGDGRADADADGLQNERDRCLLGFSQRPSGCASAGLSVRIRRIDDRTRVEVRVKSSSAVCLYGATIKLVRPSPGADRIVARKGVNLSRRATPFRALAGTGRYYAQVRRTKNAVLRCRGASSGTIRLRPN